MYIKKEYSKSTMVKFVETVMEGGEYELLIYRMMS